MSVFRLLSKEVQRKIWEMQWGSFTPIQEETIPVVLDTEKDIIVSSGTASGKTEAVFLPILTAIEQSGKNKLKVIYISPLIALINNQFERLNDLCENLDIPIHRWHGDVAANKKREFINRPGGILQITPESIESLFINRTSHLKQIFKDVDYIIIDEIHSFIPADRGVHLRALLDRISAYTGKRPRIFGLSATLSDFNIVKTWLRNDEPERVEVIDSKTSEKQLLYALFHFESMNRILPIEVVEDIRQLTKDKKTLIFCNSRKQVEELTHLLNRLSQKEYRVDGYYPHHSSIAKNSREYIEKTVAKSKRPMSIISTSTLELGIDIGAVDLVIQLDNTLTVSSLKQRLGRSGRERDSKQILQMYTTEEDSLLLALAVMELNLTGWVEPSEVYGKPYNVVFQQIISMCAESNGISKERLCQNILNISVFTQLKRDNIIKLIDNMIATDILESFSDRDELIVGMEGERILRSREFYAVFEAVEQFEVLYKGRQIGSIDISPIISEGINIILAGKLWTIQGIESERRKVHVSVAANGNPPPFSSGTQIISNEIVEKTYQLLMGDEAFNYLNSGANRTIADLRTKYRLAGLKHYERPIWYDIDKMIIETFTGTKLAITLKWMFKYLGIETKSIDSLGRITITDTGDVLERLGKINVIDWDYRKILSVTKENEMFSAKYTNNLPKALIIEQHIAQKVVLEEAIQYINEKVFLFIGDK